MIIYVMYHDEKSHQKAIELCQEWESNLKLIIQSIEKTDQVEEYLRLDNFHFSPINVPCTPFLESGTYLSLLEKFDEWKNEDYVGLVTYSIIDKLTFFLKKQMSLNWFTILKETYKKKADAIGIFGLSFCRSNTIISLLEGSVFQHGYNYYNAWRSLLQSMGYTMDKIDYDNDLGIFCNWWFTKPVLLKEYCLFLIKAMRNVNENPKLKDIFERNAHYETGNINEEKKMELFKKPYYTIHPFVFERLLSFFLAQKDNISIGCVTKMYMKL